MKKVLAVIGFILAVFPVVFTTVLATSMGYFYLIFPLLGIVLAIVSTAKMGKRDSWKWVSICAILANIIAIIAVVWAVMLGV